MNRSTLLFILYALLFTWAVMGSCKSKPRISEVEIVEDSKDINGLASDIIRETLEELQDPDASSVDVPGLKNVFLVNGLYDHYSYHPIWTSNGQWKPLSDTLLSFIENAHRYGLFPEDYFVNKLSMLRKGQLSDTARAPESHLNASLWAEADLLMTSAFVQLIKDLKTGRILPESELRKKDSTLGTGFYIRQLTAFQRSSNMDVVAAGLEPAHSGYKKLLHALRKFLDEADFKNYTYIDSGDTVHLLSSLRRRLSEEDSVHLQQEGNDSLQVANGIRQYQKIKHLEANGRITAGLITLLNRNDREKFIRIAINLDRYKQLPSPMPDHYIWVNIPGYYMQLRKKDSVRLVSKVVVGRPDTRTPVLTSAISDMITYPQWTIPQSIIKKDVLPGYKKDPAYGLRKGFSLIDKEGRRINPFQVDWAKFGKSIPYKVVQGSGDDNALGVIKFNFSNKYQVYLHDTNQRYLFRKKSRALSHGCIRVESWEPLAYYILRHEVASGYRGVPEDSLRSWLSRKQKRWIPVRSRLPLFIRYITCETANDKLLFYDDVYGEDRKLKEKYFAHKN